VLNYFKQVSNQSVSKNKTKGLASNNASSFLAPLGFALSWEYFIILTKNAGYL